MYFRKTFGAYALLAGSIFFTPSAKPASIQVSSPTAVTDCVANDPQTANPAPVSGPCSAVTPIGIAPFSSTSASFGTPAGSPPGYTFDYTVNGDLYQIGISYSASYTTNGGSSFSVNPTITYLGGAATQQQDTLILDWLQPFFDSSAVPPGGSGWNGEYGETVPLNVFGNISSDSSLGGQLCLTATTDPSMPSGTTRCLDELSAPPNSLGSDPSSSADLNFGSDNVDNYLDADYKFTYVFAAGTDPGSGISNATPEPSPLVLSLSGLLMLGLGAMRRQGRRVNG